MPAAAKQVQKAHQLVASLPVGSFTLLRSPFLIVHRMIRLIEPQHDRAFKEISEALRTIQGGPKNEKKKHLSKWLLLLRYRAFAV